MVVQAAESGTVPRPNSLNGAPIECIFDASAGKGYVAAAFEAENLAGRWLNYAKSGSG
jgi:hypothetical protein